MKINLDLKQTYTLKNCMVLNTQETSVCFTSFTGEKTGAEIATLILDQQARIDRFQKSIDQMIAQTEKVSVTDSGKYMSLEVPAGISIETMLTRAAITINTENLPGAHFVFNGINIYLTPESNLKKIERNYFKALHAKDPTIIGDYDEIK